LMKKDVSCTKIMTCDEAINDITEILVGASGEWIAEIYTKVSGKKATYEKDFVNDRIKVRWKE